MKQPNILKTLALALVAGAAILTVSSCTTLVETPAPTTTTTTTDRAAAQYPLSTTETRTTRTY